MRTGFLSTNCRNRRQFNDRRKKTAGLCETIRKRIALKIDGGEDFFVVDSKPIEVCRPARGKRCKMGRSGDFSKAPDFGRKTHITLAISFMQSAG